MKRFAAFVILIAIIFSICGCSKTKVSTNADVTLKFYFLENEIEAVLSEDEATKVIAILDGKTYSPLSSGVPSCGFDKNISLTVGNHTYAIARDTCNCIQDLGNLRFFDIPQEDMAYIHRLFEKYGGHFPCI